MTRHTPVFVLLLALAGLTGACQRLATSPSEADQGRGKKGLGGLPTSLDRARHYRHLGQLPSTLKVDLLEIEP